MAALAVRVALDPVLADAAPFLTYTAAVLVAAAFWGVGPGLSAAVLSVVAANLSLPGHKGLSLSNPHELASTAAFAVISAGIVALSAAIRRAERRAEGALSRALTLDRDRQSAVLAMHEMEEDQRLTLRALRLGTWRWDVVADRFTWAGECGRLFGLPDNSSLAGRSLGDMVHPADHDKLAAALRLACEQRRDGAVDFRVAWPDGSIHWLHAVGRVVAQACERAMLVRGIVIDIDQHKQSEMEIDSQRQRLRDLETELAHVSRVTELGQMAAALAHEINQPLAAIGNYLKASERILSIGEPGAAARAREAIGKAGEQAKRAAEVVDRLRQLMKKGQTEYRQEDVNDVVEDALAVALVGAKEAGIDVERRFEAAIPPARLDRVRIQQVVLNLVRNAIEAMRSAADLPERRLTIATALRNGLIEVRVSDTGPGLAPAVAARLFQPFITTKERGLGVGLSICRSIIEAHAGRIAAYAAPGGGTTFVFDLPAAA